MPQAAAFTTSREGESVDEICWRTLGQTRLVTEQLLELNPGLAAYGPKLPGGLRIKLPAQKQSATLIRDTVKLWE